LKFKLEIVLTKLVIKHAASEMFGILKNLTIKIYKYMHMSITENMLVQEQVM